MQCEEDHTKWPSLFSCLYNLFLFFAFYMLCLGTFLFANIKLKCCKLRLIDFFEDKIWQSENYNFL
jgi:hypothetical protein